MGGTRRNNKFLSWLRAFVGMTCPLASLSHQADAQPPPAINLQTFSLQAYARRLANEGITFTSLYNGEFAANPVGGERQGAEFTGELNWGADFDLGKLVGLDGGTVHVLFTDRAGNNLTAKSINNSTFVQEIYGDGQTYLLTTFTYEQKLFNDRIDFTIGRTDLASNFAVSPLYCYFQSNAVCGDPSFFAANINYPWSYYPLSVWGGLVQVNMTKNTYLKTGIYQNAPKLYPVRSHGFDWSIAASDGAQAAFEFGYTATQPGASEDDRYDIGIEIDRSHFPAPFYDAADPNLYGRSLVYVQGQRLLYQPVLNSPQGLYGFAAAVLGTSGSQQPADYSLEAGMLYQGMFPGRPDDDIGFMVNETRYNNRFLDFKHAQRVAAGGTQRPNSNLIMMEVNYTAQLAPWLSLTPNIQYVINPNGLGALPYPASNLRDALVFGLLLQVNVAHLLYVASAL